MVCAVSPPKPKTNLGPPARATRATAWNPDGGLQGWRLGSHGVANRNTRCRATPWHQKTIDILFRDQWINSRRYKQKKTIDNAWVMTFRHRYVLPNCVTCIVLVAPVYSGKWHPQTFHHILTFDMHCGTCPGILNNVPKRDISCQYRRSLHSMMHSVVELEQTSWQEPLSLPWLVRGSEADKRKRKGRKRGGRSVNKV